MGSERLFLISTEPGITYLDLTKIEIFEWERFIPLFHEDYARLRV
jgi:hypothetical protein